MRRKEIIFTRLFWTTKPVLILLAVAFSAGVATATPFFVETFTGPAPDNAGFVMNNPGNHSGISGGKYLMTDDFGAPGTELRWPTGQPLGSFQSHVTVELSPFETTPNPPNENTKTDFKWRFFGPDGFLEFVYNGFGTARLFHNRSGPNGGGGNLVENVDLGYTDGDVLNLTLQYDAILDNLDVSWNVNGGLENVFYSGSGNGTDPAGMGNFAGDFTDLQLFKFGSSPPDQTVASVDYWDLVPEPTSAALLALASLSLISRPSRADVRERR